MLCAALCLHGFCLLLCLPVCMSSLVPRLHSPAFYRTVYKSGVIHSAIKSWGLESGNEAMHELTEGYSYNNIALWLV